MAHSWPWASTIICGNKNARGWMSAAGGFRRGERAGLTGAPGCWIVGRDFRVVTSIRQLNSGMSTCHPNFTRNLQMGLTGGGDYLLRASGPSGMHPACHSTQSNGCGCPVGTVERYGLSSPPSAAFHPGSGLGGTRPGRTLWYPRMGTVSSGRDLRRYDCEGVLGRDEGGGGGDHYRGIAGRREPGGEDLGR